MSRLPQITPETATPAQRPLLDETARQLGRVPNLYAALVNSPAALRGYLALREALTDGELDAGQRERLALLIAQENECAYCVSAHVMRASRMHLTDDEISRTRRADSEDATTAAILIAARQTVDSGGRLSDAELQAARDAGVTDGQLAEIVAHVALNTLSNYFNHLAQPELDFPAVDVALGQPA